MCHWILSHWVYSHYVHHTWAACLLTKALQWKPPLFLWWISPSVKRTSQLTTTGILVTMEDLSHKILHCLLPRSHPNAVILGLLPTSIVNAIPLLYASRIPLEVFIDELKNLKECEKLPMGRTKSLKPRSVFSISRISGICLHYAAVLRVFRFFCGHKLSWIQGRVLINTPK